MNEIFQELKESLLFMHVPELRDTCKQLGLPFSGIKGILIHRILHFLKTGELAKTQNFPEASKAKKGINYPLLPETLILYGSCKNNAAVRAFMKTLVGDHFHFTACGIDWIKERWMSGDPPSFQGFADFWQWQHQANKKKKPTPKDEWRYIRFTQDYISKKPAASHKETIEAWKQEQTKQSKKARNIIKIITESKHSQCKH